MTDITNAAIKANELITSEIARQDIMWGASNERADTSQAQLMHAAMAQLTALNRKLDTQEGSEEDAFAIPPAIYPKDWAGFRDYGSNVANLVVAAAFIFQEIKRRIAAGEDTTRTSRNPVTQPFGTDQPSVILR